MDGESKALADMKVSVCCRHCRYWDFLNVERTYAKCKRRAPVFGGWQPTRVDDWCGEFVRRKDPDNVDKEGR